MSTSFAVDGRAVAVRQATARRSRYGLPLTYVSPRNNYAQHQIRILRNLPAAESTARPASAPTGAERTSLAPNAEPHLGADKTCQSGAPLRRDKNLHEEDRKVS